MPRRLAVNVVNGASPHRRQRVQISTFLQGRQQWLDDLPDAADSTLQERDAVRDQPRGNVVVGWEGLIVTVLHAPCNPLQSAPVDKSAKLWFFTDLSTAINPRCARELA